MTRRLMYTPAHRQRGIGAVVVVMTLFFLVSLMAAYTGRNLIFEQKTSANHVRSTVAFEAADAGIEWTLTMLNAGRINDDCGIGTGTDSNFQQRYLTIDGTGNVTRRVRGGDWWPTCVFNGTDWTCRCPDGAALSLTSPTAGIGPFPSFRSWPGTAEPATALSSPYAATAFVRPAMISVGSNGCSRLPTDGTGCLNFMPRGEFGDGVGNARAFVMLRSALAVPPAAAVTARLTVRPFGSPSAAVKLKVVNEDESSGGYTVNTGGTVETTDFEAQTLPGTPASVSFAASDSRLAALEVVSPTPPALTRAERMFASMFGMKRSTYKLQPGLRICRSPCDAAAVNGLLNANPNRIIWVEGNLVADANIGTTSSPAMLIVEGTVMSLSANVTITGFVYISGDSSTVQLPAGPTFIRGALVAEGELATAYGGTPSAGQELQVTYDRTVLDLIRNTYGSWVRMPGGWRDFKETP
jgi:hypothetical protein